MAMIKIKIRRRKEINGGFTYPDVITLDLPEYARSLDIIATLAHELGHFYDGAEHEGHEKEYIADVYAAACIGKAKYIEHLELELEEYPELSTECETHPSHTQRIERLRKTKSLKKEVELLEKRRLK